MLGKIIERSIRIEYYVIKRLKKMKFLFKIFLLLTLSLGQIGFAQSGGGCWSTELFKDFEKNSPEFKQFMDGNPDAMYAYEQLYNAGKSNLKKEINVLERYSRITKNKKLKELNVTDEMLAQIDGVAGKSYIDVLDNIENVVNNLSSKNIQLEKFDDLIKSLGRDQYAFRDGANWTLEYLGKNLDEFAGKKLIFEDLNKTDAGRRYVDISVEKGLDKIFYEFKSVKEVPPAHFTEQFLKDLQNADNLDQIKWIFDGKKNPADFRNKMEKAIDNLKIDNKTAEKFGKNNSEELKDLILDNFDKIFNIK